MAATKKDKSKKGLVKRHDRGLRPSPKRKFNRVEKMENVKDARYREMADSLEYNLSIVNTRTQQAQKEKEAQKKAERAARSLRIGLIRFDLVQEKARAAFANRTGKQSTNPAQ
eukprot:Rhum_TRINITY_DN17067_c0_g1::Rhum_TRINITY_DN17067_c0_g1_i1::g.165179::m.165179